MRYDLLRLCRGSIGQFERQFPREQFVQNHSQRVHIGLNANLLPANLFGRCVRRRHQSETCHRLIDRFAKRFQMLGDAEVQQANSPAVFHKDI